MPVVTDRAEQLRDLKALVTMTILLEPDSPSSSSSSDSSASDSDEDLFSEYDPTAEVLELYSVAESICYFEERPAFLKSREFARDFFQNLPNAYFRHITRMTKDSFWILVGLIEEHPVFSNRSPRDQVAVPIQLAATLDRLGHYGNGAALKRSGILWGVGTGSIIKFMQRCLTALEWALADAHRWPDRNERARISAEFALKGFRGCVGLVDGTLLPLSQRPKIDGEVYFDRKKRYSLNMQVICDDKLKILHMYTGLPGSCADSFCLQSSPMWRYREDERAFGPGEYLLGDSGYNGLSQVIAAFKASSAALDPEREQFNYCVAKTRVINEHCIGILKSRWHTLKEMKTQLKGPLTSVWMIRQIEACVRLHNFVHSLKDEWCEEDGIDLEADTEAENQDNNLTEASALRSNVMEECLEVNRRPGGFLS